MQALVKQHSAPGLWLSEVPEPPVGVNDVKIRVLKTGICGTDLHIYKWDAWAQKTIPVPMVVGHEFVGEVVEVGSNVTDFHPGEIVSQKIIGRFLSELVDGLITVDPHLHRISRLDEAFPGPYAIALSGAPMLAELIAKERPQAMLMGPDGESAQWVASAAAVCGFDHGVCTKVRHGDHDVRITLPAGVVVQDRHVVLLDDMASSGRTLVEACKLLRAAGARSVDVAVTHALFAADALDVIRASGVEHIWSTDSVIHASNAVALAPMMADSVQRFLHETA